MLSASAPGNDSPSGDPSRSPPGDKAHPQLIPIVPWRILVAGGVAGAVSRSLTAPLDRLKVLLQVGLGHTTNTELDHRMTKVTGFRQGLVEIWKEGGARAFFRGNGTNVIKIIPETACKFYVFEYLRQLLHMRQQPHRWDGFLAGASAGVCAQTIIYPLEIAKTRLAVSPKNEYNGIMHCLSMVVRKDGLSSLYRGLVPSLAGIIPYAGVDLAVYSYLKEAWQEQHGGVLDVPSRVLLACGSVSCLCGQLVAYPFQLVRTRLQAQGSPGRPIVYTGMVDCFSKVLLQDGVVGLYRGLLPNILKAVPAISLTYVTYEKVKLLLSEPAGTSLRPLSQASSTHSHPSAPSKPT